MKFPLHHPVLKLKSLPSASGKAEGFTSVVTLKFDPPSSGKVAVSAFLL
jgi:hypothetical protein